MQLVIPTMCQKYDAIDSLWGFVLFVWGFFFCLALFFYLLSLAPAVVLFRAVHVVYSRHPSCHALPDLR